MADTKPPTNLVFNLHIVIDKLKHSLNFQMKMKRKYLKDLLEEIEKEFIDYQLQIEDFMKFKERKLQIEKSVSTKFLFLIKDLDKELKKLRN